MPSRKATKALNTKSSIPVEQRRSRVADLLATFMPQSKIAEVLDVSKATISRDVKQIRNDWAKNNRESFERFKAQCEAGLELVVQKAFIEFEKSKRPKTIVKESTGPDGTVKSTTIEERCGDPRYLSVAQQALSNMIDKVLPKDLPNILMEPKIPVVPVLVTTTDEVQKLNEIMSNQLIETTAKESVKHDTTQQA